MNWPGIHRRGLLAGLLVAGVAPVLLPAGRAEEPRWLTLRIPETSFEVDAEAKTEDYTVSGVKYDYKQLTLTPLLGLRAQGSIYHPNLLSFDLSGAAGWGWDNITSKSSGINTTRNQSQEVQRYLAQVYLLSAKPYNASFFAAQDHTYRDYDAFSSYTVDSTRYGGRMNWLTDNLNLSADMGYRNENNSGLNDSSEITETYLNFNGFYTRPMGQTTLNYRYDEFNNTYGYSGIPATLFASSQNSVNQSVGLSDSETFGSRKQINATTGVGYSLSHYGGQQTETVFANENITVDHRPNLSSLFSLDYSDSTLTAASASRLQGDYAVRHQLYESLTTRLDAHGNYDENSSLISSGSDDRYGLGWSEQYSKRLGLWGHLSLGTSVVIDHVDYNSSGGILTTIDERHQLYAPTSINYRPVYLTQPRVIELSVVVRGPGGIPAQLNADYQLIRVGQLTEIQLIPTSTILRNGDIVTVTYRSDSLINSSFEELNANVQIRVDLFGHLGLYSRLNWLDNNAPPQVLTETLTDVVGGVDYTWQWLRAGAEYEDYNSTFTQFQAWRFFQNFSFHPADASTLTVDFLETVYSYPRSGEQTQYLFVTRYNVQLLFSLAWYVEGGYSIMNVPGTDESLAAAKTGLSWSRGKLSLRAGYEYNRQDTTTGLQSSDIVRNRFYAYLKRTF